MTRKDNKEGPEMSCQHVRSTPDPSPHRSWTKAFVATGRVGWGAPFHALHSLSSHNISPRQNLFTKRQSRQLRPHNCSGAKHSILISLHPILPHRTPVPSSSRTATILFRPSDEPRPATFRPFPQLNFLIRDHHFVLLMKTRKCSSPRTNRKMMSRNVQNSAGEACEEGGRQCLASLARVMGYPEVTNNERVVWPL
ncbi:hypothetical protein P154DRAFT_116134 [Amniculicola lignicola CBS 123094]|uniref:Uncharacterized protein n=1 Tax=Amniculicola lignicola CBS 123094 TaxID=1392246 RepID=A0A6A5X066_9PLEO|nr:hypothetical protein P154DRAFT_116134 [Amniculicola lignicola CBS 123094]